MTTVTDRINELAAVERKVQEEAKAYEEQRKALDEAIRLTASREMTLDMLALLGITIDDLEQDYYRDYVRVDDWMIMAQKFVPNAEGFRAEFRIAMLYTPEIAAEREKYEDLPYEWAEGNNRSYTPEKLAYDITVVIERIRQRMADYQARYEHSAQQAPPERITTAEQLETLIQQIAQNVCDNQ